MTPDRLETMLRDLPAPPSTEARERAVAEARAEIAGREELARSPRGAGRRALAIALAAAVLGGALLTPPGREASGWVGELVGIGEVGGSPTLEDHGFQWSSRGVVIANGRAPDGSRYEWVVYDCRSITASSACPSTSRASAWPSSGRTRKAAKAAAAARRPKAHP
jgi:hypothetical protein